MRAADAFEEEWEVRRDPGGRPRLYTEKVLAQIPAWLSEGWPLDAIAVRLGTTKMSLWISCAKYNIRLRDAKLPVAKPPTRLRLPLPNALLRKLEKRAEAMSASTEHLILLLLNRIIADDLFDAVLDFDGMVERPRPRYRARTHPPRYRSAAPN